MSARRAFTGRQHGQARGDVTVEALLAATRARLGRRGARRARSPLLAGVLAGAALLVSANAARAQESYGEIGRFGSVGTGQGQFELTGPPSSTTAGTHALGVDPADGNAVYIGDEPRKREYRIQKLDASGTFVAATPLLAPPNRDGIEGIAVDETEQRIYVLALERRGESLAIDPTKPAAGTLYAFSTAPSGQTLVPAPGTNAEGVLVGPGTFESQSDASEVALLNPTGIAVDPVTHDVVVLGEVEAPPEGREPHPRIALQLVNPGGTLGKRYVDDTGYLGAERSPNSPIVTPSGSIYVAIDQQQSAPGGGALDEIAQIPTALGSTEPPTPAIRFPLTGVTPGEHPVVEFDENEPASRGGGLAIAPGGPGGQETIYARGDVSIRNGESFSPYPGVLAFDAAGGQEAGWTGGQTRKVGESCAIATGAPGYDSIAAGSGGDLFVLDPPASRIIELGPGGKGCPAAEASTPAAVVDGQSLAPTETVAPGTPVTFSSTLTQANALSVEWNFGDGQTVTESTDEHQHVEITHSFVRGGELTVTETIHTDDLATPTLTEQTKISVSDVALPPIASLEGPLELTLGAASAQTLAYLEGGGLGLQTAATGAAGAALASFDGSASHDPNPPGSNRIVAYHWTFGDGSTETTATAAATHSYGAAGVYKVELTVTDAHGLTSEPAVLSVRVNPAPPPKSEVPAVAPPPAASTPPAQAAAGSPSRPSASIPAVGLTSTALAAKGAGTVQVVLTCPSDETSCIGTATLRTLGPVSLAARHSRRRLARHTGPSVTLARGAFTVAGGHQKVLTLRLTRAARGLLGRSHGLSAQLVLIAHDPAGATHTTKLSVTLRAGFRRVKK